MALDFKPCFTRNEYTIAEVSSIEVALKVHRTNDFHIKKGHLLGFLHTLDAIFEVLEKVGIQSRYTTNVKQTATKLYRR